MPDGNSISQSITQPVTAPNASPVPSLSSSQQIAQYSSRLPAEHKGSYRQKLPARIAEAAAHAVPFLGLVADAARNSENQRLRGQATTDVIQQWNSVLPESQQLTPEETHLASHASSTNFGRELKHEITPRNVAFEAVSLVLPGGGLARNTIATGLDLHSSRYSIGSDIISPQDLPAGSSTTASFTVFDKDGHKKLGTIDFHKDKKGAYSGTRTISGQEVTNIVTGQPLSASALPLNTSPATSSAVSATTSAQPSSVKPLISPPASNSAAASSAPSTRPTVQQPHL